MRRLGQHLAIIGFRAQFTDRDSYGLFSRFHSISPPHIFPLICTLHYSLHSYLYSARGDVDLKVKLILNNFALVTLPLPWLVVVHIHAVTRVVLHVGIIQRNRAVQIFVSIR